GRAASAEAQARERVAGKTVEEDPEERDAERDDRRVLDPEQEVLVLVELVERRRCRRRGREAERVRRRVRLRLERRRDCNQEGEEVDDGDRSEKAVRDRTPDAPSTRAALGRQQPPT